MTTIKARAKVWSGSGVTPGRFRVDADGTVRVYDPIARHYTTCHAMSESTVRRIRRLAKSKAADAQ